MKINLGGVKLMFIKVNIRNMNNNLNKDIMKKLKNGKTDKNY